MKTKLHFVSLVAFVFAACGDDGGNPSTDGAPGGADAAVIDAAASDATVSDASAAPDGAVNRCIPQSGTTLTLEVFAENFVEPIFVTSPPGDARMFVVERAGRIRVIKDGSTLPTPFLDIRGQVQSADLLELGLLGLAFHPNYATNGRFFIYYTEDIAGGAPYRAVIAEGHADPTSDVADAGETRVLTLEQPAFNHNGGMMAFSPSDGYLYIGLGDGGYDWNESQDTSTLLGGMLRIDVNNGAPYQVPADNPFVASAGADEVWSYGWRNPWRWSFDRQTGDMYVGDVGEGDREEVSVHPASRSGGINFGWPLCEGDLDFSDSCTASGLEPPIAVRNRDNGRCSIIGGYVYRGTCMPDVRGWYFFGDWCSREVWKLEYSGGNVTGRQDLSSQIGVGMVSFGEDSFGELYIVELGGTIFKIVLD